MKSLDEITYDDAELQAVASDVALVRMQSACVEAIRATSNDVQRGWLVKLKAEIDATVKACAMEAESDNH